MTDSREAILERIRAGLGPSADPAPEYAAIPRDYIRSGPLDSQARLHMLIERLRDYDTHVVESDAAAVPDTVLTILRNNGQKKVIAADGLPAELLPAEFRFLPEREATIQDLDHCDGIVTLC